MWIKGNLRRFFVFFFELWLAATLVLVLLCVLANTRRSSEMSSEAAEVCNCSQIGIASSPISEEVTATSGDSIESSFADLAELLPKVAMEDRTVIITSVNEAFARSNSLLDLFRESFVAGEKIAHLLDHVLVVAVDPAAFDHCRAVHPHCYHLKVKSMDLSSANNFMSETYVELVWTKLSLQQRVLELGYNFLFTDVDILWFRDPFRHIGVFADMTTSCDVFNGDGDDLSNWPNTGFYYVKSTNRTVEMLRRWRAARARYPPNHEQNIFNYIKHELAASLGVRVRFLDTAVFGGFCQLFHNDMARACTMHANCCVGLGNKLHDLRSVLDQWTNYTSLAPPEERKKNGGGGDRRAGWSVPAKCGTPDKRGGHYHHLTSFLLGALLPTVLLFFLASDRVGERLSTISSLGNGALAVGGRATARGGDDLTGVDGSAPAPAEKEKEKFPGLAELLPEVAMEDKTVIITSVNEAWAAPGSLLDLFRDSFNNGDGIAHLLDHVLVVAVDAGGFRRCKAVHPHCYLLDVVGAGAGDANLSSANRFMSRGYLELVWAKLSLQQRVLELGYSFLFTDVDIMWLRDPFRHISLYADVTISSDHFYGDAGDVARNSPNTGFYHVRSTNRTVEMLRYWRAARSRFPPESHDQNVFNGIKRELAGGELRVRIVFLDTAIFGGFCEYRPDAGVVCTVHANCCVGLENKVHDLKNVLADWKNYTAGLTSPEKKKNSAKFRWTFPAKCKASLKRH
uniref:Nucleotide-diphospho-sugar transferase domain-containing protein n=1 Tax=Oryza punctata TaxID=4537 RepID=A0A0E0JSW7_ORYPU